jgi:hypothetical protein
MSAWLRKRRSSRGRDASGRFEVIFEFVLTESELVITVPLGEENPNSDEEAERRAATPRSSSNR